MNPTAKLYVKGSPSAEQEPDVTAEAGYWLGILVSVVLVFELVALLTIMQAAAIDV